MGSRAKAPRDFSWTCSECQATTSRNLHWCWRCGSHWTHTATGWQPQSGGDSPRGADAKVGDGKDGRKKGKGKKGRGKRQKGGK
eukprot:9242248-Pyramimonas_sp.AAC.1